MEVVNLEVKRTNLSYNHYYYPKKKFLWFFFVRIKNSYGEYKRFWSEEEAMDYIQKFLQDLKEEKLTKRKLINFSNLKAKKKRKKYENI